MAHRPTVTRAHAEGSGLDPQSHPECANGRGKRESLKYSIRKKRTWWGAGASDEPPRPSQGGSQAGPPFAHAAQGQADSRLCPASPTELLPCLGSSVTRAVLLPDT